MRRPGIAFVAAALLLASTASAGPRIHIRPELPRALVEMPSAAATGRTLPVRAGGNFQAALDAAEPGDVIILEAGATFVGPFKLPVKRGAAWITIRTSAPDDRFPPSGTRVGPSHAALMPKLVAGSGSAIMTAPGAHHYRFVGVEIRPREGVFLYNLVQLGATERTLDALPHHIIFERSYLHGDQRKGTRRGIAMNSRDTAVVDSYLSDFKEAGADSQAICGWNGAGPFKIINNYLEAAGENVMFGGADPQIGDLVPSDIEIRHNLFAKPLSWKIGEAQFAGIPWTVKNLFELKNARRVLVEGNIFEHNWVHAQNGFAILFTPANQDGRSPWSVVEDVTFVNNVVRRTAGGINILGRRHAPYRTEQTRRILVRNNLFEEIGDPRWGGNGRLFQVLDGTSDVVIEKNTASQTGSIIVTEGAPHTGFVYRLNAAPHNEYGIVGSGSSPGMSTIERYFPGAVIEGNAIAGGPATAYPLGNSFATSPDRLVPQGRARGPVNDRSAVGVDLRALCAVLATSADLAACAATAR